MRIAIAFSLLLLACSPYRGLRKQTITYDGGSKTVYVPKKFERRQPVYDSLSKPVSGEVFNYGSGRTLYFVQLPDTASFYQTVDTTKHVAVLHPAGARMYKCIDSAGRYWREVQQGRMRYGYTDISFDDQIKFDTAVNSAITPRRRRGLF